MQAPREKFQARHEKFQAPREKMQARRETIISHLSFKKGGAAGEPWVLLKTGADSTQDSTDRQRFISPGVRGEGKLTSHSEQ